LLCWLPERHSLRPECYAESDRELGNQPGSILLEKAREPIRDVIPVLNEILEIAPDIRILGSPARSSLDEDQRRRKGRRTERGMLRGVLLWNLAADPQNRPHTDGGGYPMCQGAITIDRDSVSLNLAYYTIARASKFVRPGSVRIASTNRGDQSVDPTEDEERPGMKRLAVIEDTQDCRTSRSGHSGRKNRTGSRQ
jgi:hypothetical protein